MTRLFTYATIVILGATATLAVRPAVSLHRATRGAAAEARLAADAAFRDGLYLGKLAAEAGQPMRTAIGRWSREQDRIMFAAGYRRGYNGASTIADAEGGSSTE
jgi:hypothetical protein